MRMYFFEFSAMAIFAIFIKCIALILLCSFLLFSSYFVDGVEEDNSLTKDEELEIDYQFKLLNKPAFKTIKTTHGDLYDCVDFYKQPAFDHPLLKNHSFHPRMRPPGQTSVSKRMRRNKRSNDEQIGHIRLGCPSGTVPIRRVTKEELVRAKLHEKLNALRYGVLTLQEPGVHYAITKTIFDPNKKYRGGSAHISVYNVTVHDPSQYSLARMRIQGGTDFIEVGTQTNPGIYNNLDTHIFIRTKTSHADCFNLRCSGFIQVIEGHSIDRVVVVSERGVSLINVVFSLVREDDNNWWFYLGEEKEVIGFWPPIFDGGLQGLATGIDWGGEVSGKVGIWPAPMGSSHCPEEDTVLDGNCQFMKTINEGKQETDANVTEIYCDSKFYEVKDEGFVGLGNRRLMFFGGPGRGTEC